MDPRPIAVIGNANLDIVGGMLAEWPETGTETFLETSDMRIGGSAANTALVLDRLHAANGLISAAGTDLAGTLIAERFSKPLDRIARMDGPTSVTFGVLHPGSERTFFSTRGHLDRLTADDFLQGLAVWPLDGALALVSGSFAMPAFTDATGPILTLLKQRGAQTAIDPGWPGDGWTRRNSERMREWMAISDHVLINDKELAGFAGNPDEAAALAEIAGLISADTALAVKCGGRGALCVQPGTSVVHVPTQTADVMDTIGAGDAFNAGYLAAIARGLPPDRAVRAGCRVATAVVSHFPRRDTALNLDGEEPAS